MVNEDNEKLELSMHLNRDSVLYAHDIFTVYISVKNKEVKGSGNNIKIWGFGILGNSDFYFERVFKETGSIVGTPKSLPEKIQGIWSFFKDMRTGKAQPEEINLNENEIKELADKDMLKEYYYTKLDKNDVNSLPWILEPGETRTVNFYAHTRHSMLFRPDKYNLTLFADYSVKNKEKDIFARVTKMESVEILSSIFSLIVAGIIGGISGAVARLFINHKVNGFYGLSDFTNIVEIAASGIISMFGIIALARRTGTQPFITIQDFWGGLLIGFIMGYYGKNVFDTIFGMTQQTPSAIINQSVNQS